MKHDADESTCNTNYVSKPCPQEVGGSIRLAGGGLSFTGVGSHSALSSWLHALSLYQPKVILHFANI